MLALLAMFASRALAGGKEGDADSARHTRQPAGDLSEREPDLPTDGVLGGLGGLLDSFQKSGQGETVNSWVSAGPNKRVSPDQLRGALGGTNLEQLARRTGMSQEDLLAQLSQILPGAVDRLTPDGRMPTEHELKRLEKARAKARH